MSQGVRKPCLRGGIPVSPFPSRMSCAWFHDELVDQRRFLSFTMASRWTYRFMMDSWIIESTLGLGIHDGLLDSRWILGFTIDSWIHDGLLNSWWIPGFTMDFWSHDRFLHSQWIFELAMDLRYIIGFAISFWIKPPRLILGFFWS